MQFIFAVGRISDVRCQSQLEAVVLSYLCWLQWFGTSQVQAIKALMGHGSGVHCQTLLNDITDSIKPSLLFSYSVGIQYFWIRFSRLFRCWCVQLMRRCQNFVDG